MGLYRGSNFLNPPRGLGRDSGFRVYGLPLFEGLRLGFSINPKP